MAETTRVEIRNERTRQVIDRVNHEMHEWTMQRLAELRMTSRGRKVAENAFKKVEGAGTTSCPSTLRRSASSSTS